jgi:hypothetical protein
MKKDILLSAMLLLCASAPLRGQLVLNGGQTFSYQFETLPFNRLIVGQPAANYGYFYLAIHDSTFTAGDSLRLEFFENSFLDSPIRTMEFTSSDTPPIGIYVGQAWQDIQGAFRITQLTGSTTIDSINVQATRMNPDLSFNFYQQILNPAPEPSALIFFLVAAAAGLGVRRWKHC